MNTAVFPPKTETNSDTHSIIFIRQEQDNDFYILQLFNVPKNIPLWKLKHELYYSDILKNFNINIEFYVNGEKLNDNDLIQEKIVYVKSAKFHFSKWFFIVLAFFLIHILPFIYYKKNKSITLAMLIYLTAILIFSFLLYLDDRNVFISTYTNLFTIKKIMFLFAVFLRRLTINSFE